MYHANHVRWYRTVVVGVGVSMVGVLMPIYEYRCHSCDNTAIIRATINQTPQPPQCDVCQASMIRLWSAPGVSFKGTGWGKDGK